MRSLRSVGCKTTLQSRAPVPLALYHGDNLAVLRAWPAAHFDLIYLDPPFNTNHDFKAFDDRWANRKPALPELLKPFAASLDPKALAYYAFMYPRLKELHRLLKRTGSLYLHCDSHTVHYLKIFLDSLFGAKQYRNELIWKRSSAHSDSSVYGRIHDVILFYTKSNDFTWHKQHTPYDEEYVAATYNRVNDEGRRYGLFPLTTSGLHGKGYRYTWNGVAHSWRRPEHSMQKLHNEGRIEYAKSGMPQEIKYLDAMAGIPLQDIWTDIKPVMGKRVERTGYPTQKPEELLTRIIRASSNPGELILDPFAGSGTTLVAAELLGRNWVGIDLGEAAIRTIKQRFGTLGMVIEEIKYAAS